MKSGVKNKSREQNKLNACRDVDRNENNPFLPKNRSYISAQGNDDFSRTKLLAVISLTLCSKD